MRRRDFMPVSLAAAAGFGQARPELGDPLPLRQIRLSAQSVRNAGPDLARLLREFRTQLLTVFAKDASGKVDHELLALAAEACGQASIALSYQYSLSFDELQLRSHPEWRAQGTVPQNTLCLNSPYLDVVIAHHAEILRRHPSLGGAVLADLRLAVGGCSCRWCEQGERAPRLVAQKVLQRLGAILQGRTLSCDGHEGIEFREIRDFFTHVETQGPIRIRYARTLGKDVVAITTAGQSLTSAAMGAKVCLLAGDLQSAAQPFQELEALEPWCRGARALADIGILGPAGEAVTRCAEMLRSLHHQFDVVDGAADFAAYRVIIAPQTVPPPLEAKLRDYTARGGALLLVSEGPPAATPAALQFRKGMFPESFEGILLPGPDPDFTADPAAQVLASTRGTAQALITRRASRLHVAGRVFDADSAPLRELVTELLYLQLPKPAIQTRNIPPTASVHMLEQRLQGGMRRVVHVLQGPDDTQPLHDVQLWVRLPQHPLAVVTVPDQRPLEFVHNEFYTTFTIPVLRGHRAIAFE